MWRLDAYQRRRRWLGFPVAVVYKFADDHGGYLAALITYYGFLSIFPLMLLGSSVLGFLLQNDAELRGQLRDTVLAQFPVVGGQLALPEGLTGSTTAIVIGLLGALYGALGIAQAMQFAANTAWSVPRVRRPDPVTSRLRGLLGLGAVGLAVLGASGLSMLSDELDAVGGALAQMDWVIATLLTLALYVVVFSLVFWLAAADRPAFRAVVPGAVLAALLLRAMQFFATAYIDSVVRNTSFTYGVFAVVLGLLAWIYVGSVVFVLCIELDVVRTRVLYPRALAGPFTEDVELTEGDRRAYTAYARAQQAKTSQSVAVDFGGGGDQHVTR
jgi:membrane protein